MADGMQKVEHEKPKAKTGLELLREPFPENAISKLPKPTKQQTEALKAAVRAKDWSVGIRCDKCGQYHHKDVIHLDYVGHAALTDRLLECDPNWNWEPMARDQRGLPLIDENGGMWINLTVCGVTRPGYGDAPGKNGGDAVKEVIGDALRNAAIRFGAALNLWHKGDLHSPPDPDDGEPTPREEEPQPRAETPPKPDHRVFFDRLKAAIEKADTPEALAKLWTNRNTAIVVAEMPEELGREIRKIHQAREEQLAPPPPFDDFDPNDIPFE